MKRFMSLMLACIVLVTLLTACGPPEKGPETPGAESLVRMAISDIPVIDPAVGMTESALIIYPNVYDTLVKPKADGSVENSIAEDYSVSADGLTFEFTLKKGVKFHDGTELTAEDVKYSMDRAIRIGQGLGFLFVKKIASTETVDSHTVRFNLTSPSGVFLPSLVRLYIVNKDLLEANYKDGSYGEHGDYGMTYLQNADAGSGPYEVELYEQNQAVTVKKFIDYWGGFHQNNPDRAKFMNVDETVTQVTMMSNRELEISNPYLALETYEQLAAMEGIDIAGFSKGDLMSLSTNTRKVPLDDEHVRKALAHCIDYDSLINTLYPGSKRANSCVPLTVLGYNDNAVNVTFSLDKARDELALSKYADTIGDYEIEVAWVANCPDREKIALMLQANAAQLGFKISIYEVPWASIVDTSSTPETTYHMVTVITVPDYAEVGSIFETSFSDIINGNPNTMSWAGSPELDARILDAVTTLDIKEREQKYIELQMDFMDSMPTIPLFEQKFQYAYQSSYLDWTVANQPVPAIMGANVLLRDMLIYPEKKK